jgi:hypothetical protein
MGAKVSLEAPFNGVTESDKAKRKALSAKGVTKHQSGEKKARATKIKELTRIKEQRGAAPAPAPQKVKPWFSWESTPTPHEKF